MKDFIDFLKNRTFHKHFISAFVGLIVFIYLIFLSLRVYTRHGQALSVPNFSGLSIEDASKLTDLKNLRYVIIDSIFIQGQEPGTIVAQNPSPNTKVKENRTIFFTINAFNPEKVKMPNILGLSYRLAETTLVNNGLKVGARRYVPDIGRDYVLRQIYKNREIKPGTLILKGSAVDLVLGLGEGSSEISVPDVKRLTLNKAIEALSEMYINLGAIIYDNSVETREDSLKAVIYRQNPTYGASIRSGNEIDVWLTTDKSKAGISEPDSVSE